MLYKVIFDEMVILVLCYKKSSICQSKTRLVTVLKNTRKGNFQKPSKNFTYFNSEEMGGIDYSYS